MRQLFDRDVAQSRVAEHFFSQLAAPAGAPACATLGERTIMQCKVEIVYRNVEMGSTQDFFSCSRTGQKTTAAGGAAGC